MFQSLLSFLLASTFHLSPVHANDSFDARSLLHIEPLPTLEAAAAPAPELSAQSALGIDLETQSPLYEKNSFDRRPIASLTKLMTAYIILKESDPNAVVTVSAEAAATEGSRMGLHNGEQITVKNLLYGLLIESGNDAAHALAEFNAGSESAFVQKMNTEAALLGMENTHYSNESGLDEANAYSTAHDLLILSSHVIQDPGVREIVNNSKTQVTSVDGTVHTLTNTNLLLGQMGIEGLKTGTTLLAGECLISLAKSPDGHEILLIVLGSKDRFSDMRNLVDWVYHSYHW